LKALAAGQTVPIGRVGRATPLESKIGAVSGEGGFDNEEESI
jgi:hypothetical protein